MGNCLKTQLKGSVNNDNLLIFGGVPIFLKNGTNDGSIKVAAGQEAYIYKYPNGNHIDLSGSSQLNTSDLANAEYEEYIFVSKYDAFPITGSTNGFQNIKFNIEDFAFIEPKKLVNIYFQYALDVSGNLESLPNSDYLTSITAFSAPNITGSLSNIIQKFPNIGKNDGSLNLHSSKGISGNVSALGALKYMPAAIYLGGTAVEGNYYDAIVGWRTNIGQSGETPSLLGNSNIHLFSVYPGTSAFKLAWTPTTSSITVGGVTTTFDNSGNIIS